MSPVLKTTARVHVLVSRVRQRRQAWPAAGVSWPGRDQLGLILSWPSPVRVCTVYTDLGSGGQGGQRPSAQDLSLRSCCSAPSSALQVSGVTRAQAMPLTVPRILVTSLTSDTSDMTQEAPSDSQAMGAQASPWSPLPSSSNDNLI